MIEVLANTLLVIMLQYINAYKCTPYTYIMLYDDISIKKCALHKV